MTKRQKEIIVALNEGARLYPPGFCSHQWQIQKLPVTSKIKEWIYDDTIQRMKKDGLLIRSDVANGIAWLRPSPAALAELVTA